MNNLWLGASDEDLQIELIAWHFRCREQEFCKYIFYCFVVPFSNGMAGNVDWNSTISKSAAKFVLIFCLDNNKVSIGFLCLEIIFNIEVLRIIISV